MATIFLDGFDKYGTPLTGVVSASQAFAEWNGGQSTHGPTGTVVSGLSAKGYAWQLTANSLSNGVIYRYLNGNKSRLIGGVRFQIYSPTGLLIQFVDSSTVQCYINVLPTGYVALYNGSGTLIKATTLPIITNLITYYLEWDITFGSSASYSLYINGTSVVSGTGNTISSANSWAQIFALGVSYSGIGGYVVVDDLYLFDTAGSTNNAVLLTSPVIETRYPSSDSSVAFAINAGTVNYMVGNGTALSSSNQTYLIKIIPSVNCTINSISAVPNAGSSANFKGVIYTDSSGPHSLLSGGTQITGTTSGTALVLPLTTPQSLAAGTVYWIGFISDTGLSFSTNSSYPVTVVYTSSTYSSGPLATIASTTGAGNFCIWGNVTPGVQYYEVSQVPPPGDISSITATSVGTSDLFGFPALTSNPTVIYSAGVKAYTRTITAGNRTVNLQISSSSVIGNGNTSNLMVTGSYLYLDSYFDTDPNTGAAWTQSNINAATSGIIITE